MGYTVFHLSTLWIDPNADRTTSFLPLTQMQILLTV